MAAGRGRVAERVLWTALAIAATIVLSSFREEIGEAHVALTYLLIVLGASARGGRRLGLVLALACFLAFNFFFIAPYHTLAIHNPLDWLVLLAFLVTSAVATLLLHRAQSQAEAARQRAREIDRLAALGAETLNAGRAEESLVAIAKVIRSGLGVAACEIYESDASTGRARRVAKVGDAPEDARTLYVPLRVRDRPVGVLRLESAEAIILDAAQQRFAEALAYYAALGLERIRLTAAAEHAEALREADRLKDVLLASVSHDLRTPLTTIKALAHAIAADGDERAVVVEEEADRLNRFVSDLLDLSQLNVAPPVAPELVAAEDVIGAALQRLSGALDLGRTIDASLDPAEPILVGRLDFVHTLRALVNLIDNALKYSPPGATVEVSARRRGDRLAFTVADRGRGVAPDEAPRIFEPFYRGPGDPAVQGTGLGLPIARRSAELQGGALEYAARPGGGSIFTLLLPAADPAELERMS